MFLSHMFLWVEINWNKFQNQLYKYVILGQIKYGNTKTTLIPTILENKLLLISINFTPKTATVA